ncbi:hypothetical protein PV327_010104 [Microctonus hyperodae]|uniref:Uncharacterized protein n=1 Tax=Microctonus hyperodae TaxID=165561 RepID=A0AA39FS16_MICHY|nr:hypothetical protein PV327_010104 [Microctonus hyperodae]
MRCYLIDDIQSERFIQIDDHNVLKVWTNNPANIEKLLKKFATNLRKIMIEDRCWEDIPPFFYKSLTKCTKLTHLELDFQRSGLMERFLEILPTKKLEHLSLHLWKENNGVQSQLSYLIKNVLAKTPKLKSLNFNHMPISGLSSLGGMGTLKALSLSGDDLPHLNFNIEELRNLEMLEISYSKIDNAANIIALLKKCRKVHTVQFSSTDIFPETVLNEMMSLPNLRRLHLHTDNNTYESWHKFSNLEEILIVQSEPLSSTRNQIKSFLQRSKNLKLYDFEIRNQHNDFGIFIHEVASDIGHECKRHRSIAWNW